MNQSDEKRNRTNKWSELCPDLLRCVLERLSFPDLSRAKSVCSSWHSASRLCTKYRNQIPWLIILPPSDNNGSCLMFVPDDRDRVYKTRDLGVDFARSSCLATYGSWLLMMDIHWNLNIQNPLTGEKIVLPVTTESIPFALPILCEQLKPSLTPGVYMSNPTLACLWIDDRSKDYVVVWKFIEELVFTKKGKNTWRRFGVYSVGGQLVYQHKDQKLYFHGYDGVTIWCLSGDDPLEKFEYHPPVRLAFWEFLTGRCKDDKEEYVRLFEWYRREFSENRLEIAVSTVSGEVFQVDVVQMSKTWLFCISKINHKNPSGWELIDSLGDEALILDMGITVLAKAVPGLERNSIYFSGLDFDSKNPDHIFVFDLATHKIEPVPQCVFTSIPFSGARWFFPGFSG